MSNKPRLFTLFASCLGIAALFFGALPGHIVQAQAAAKTFRPSADAYVMQSSPTSNYGTAANLRVDGSPILRSYLRFTVSGLSGAAVQSAKLRLYANSTAGGLTVNGLANNSWTETGLTFANAPAPGNAIKTSAAATGGQWLTIDISSYVKAEGTYNLVLTPIDATNFSLGARETGANAPQLVITTASVVPNATVTRQPTLVPTRPAPTATARPAPDRHRPLRRLAAGLPDPRRVLLPLVPRSLDTAGNLPLQQLHPHHRLLQLGRPDDPQEAPRHDAVRQHPGRDRLLVGPGAPTPIQIPGLLAAAAGTRFRWSLYYENESGGDPSASQIQADLVYIRDHYGKNPNYLRVNGKFVVFVYSAGNDACGMVSRWKQANTVGAYVVLKVFPGYANCAGQPDSWHQYAPAVAADQQGSFSYTVSPGFWLKGNERAPARATLTAGRRTSRTWPLRTLTGSW